MKVRDASRDECGRDMSMYPEGPRQYIRKRERRERRKLSRNAIFFYYDN